MSNTEYEIHVEMLSALESGELGDFDRGVLAEELVKRLKETKSSLPEYGIYPDQFVFDGQLSIICGDRGQWEIILWSDGVVEAVTYFQGSIFDPVYEVDLKSALLNPQLVMEQLVSLIGYLCDHFSFETDTEVTYSDLEYSSEDEDWYVK